MLDRLVTKAPRIEAGPPPNPTRKLRIVDVGCGRAYLTFAAHHHFSAPPGGDGTGPKWEVETTGVELRVDLVDEVQTFATTFVVFYSSL